MKTSLLRLLAWLLLAGLVSRGRAATAAPAITAPADPLAGFAALPGEVVLVPQLRGILCLADERDATAAVPADFRGLDVTRVPLLEHDDAKKLLGLFLDRPASIPSLGRLGIATRTWLQASGQPFVVAYVPPQDLTAGVVRLVVHRARLDGEVRIEGASWSSESYYRAAVGQATSAEIDPAALQSGVAWLNENPYRRVVVAAESGAAPGTTRLALRVQEERPLRFTLGYANTGTAVTGENRVMAGVAWGNAFGRGDQLGYTFAADPRLEHSLSHSANYTTIFRSRRALTLYGAWSKIESELPAPLTQTGHSGQAGARLSLPLPALKERARQHLDFSADFKASDNTLEFAALPITDNLTHVVQFGASYGVSFPALGGQNDLSVSGVVSPGGLSSRNHGRYFDMARPGAPARYAYARLGLAHRQAFGRGFAWTLSADAQFAGVPLLGTEQLNGGGIAGVRGYGENTAFGDAGAVVNNELHLPAFKLLGGGVDLFAFFDLASLQLSHDDQSTDLRSAGLGVNYQWRRYMSLRFAYGRHPNNANGVTTPESGHGHVGANVSW